MHSNETFSIHAALSEQVNALQKDMQAHLRTLTADELQYIGGGVTVNMTEFGISETPSRSALA